MGVGGRTVRTRSNVHMTKWVIALLAAGALVVPAAAYADDGGQGKTKSPAQQCRDERSANASGFKEKYGTNHNKRNAFGKCVSKTAHSLNKSDQDDDNGQSGDHGQSGEDHGKSGENHGPPS
jgi:hypothetical protein